MVSSYKTYVESDLASVHYVTFIEPLTVCPTETVIEEKMNDSFVLLEEHYFTAFLVYKKSYKFKFEDMSHKILQFFAEP
jgi:hypothetical protein